MTTSQGFHLAMLGSGGALLEPQHGINPGDPGASIGEVLRALREHRAKRLYYDLSDVAIIDPVYYAFLNRLATSCHAIGIAMTCVSMQPSAAFSLAAHLDEPPRFATAHGLEEGEARISRGSC